MDWSLPGSSVNGVFQARVLEWVALSFSRFFPDPGIEPGSPALRADALPSEPPGKLALRVAYPLGKTIFVITACSSIF